MSDAGRRLCIRRLRDAGHLLCIRRWLCVMPAACSASAACATPAAHSASAACATPTARSASAGQATLIHSSSLPFLPPEIFRLARLSTASAGEENVSAVRLRRRRCSGRRRRPRPRGERSQLHSARRRGVRKTSSFVSVARPNFAPPRAHDDGRSDSDPPLGSSLRRLEGEDARRLPSSYRQDRRSHHRGSDTICDTSARIDGQCPTDMILTVLDRCGRKLEDNTRKAAIIAGNVWHHLKTSPNITDAALARLSQGTKVLAEGGNDKVFHQTFGYFPGEQLWNAYACYISTSAGPVIGILYLSTVRIAFCSDHPLCYSSFNGQQEWAYYKVVVPLDQLKAVNTSTNARNPSEKYIQIITKDNHEFWFLGFISYEKALKHLKEALQLHVSPRGSH